MPTNLIFFLFVFFSAMNYISRILPARRPPPSRRPSPCSPSPPSSPFPPPSPVLPSPAKNLVLARRGVRVPPPTSFALKSEIWNIEWYWKTSEISEKFRLTTAQNLISRKAIFAWCEQMCQSASSQELKEKQCTSHYLTNWERTACHLFSETNLLCLLLLAPSSLSPFETAHNILLLASG